jgi:hypothetical protein
MVNYCKTRKWYNGLPFLLPDDQLKYRRINLNRSARNGLCVPGMGAFGLQECKPLILRVKVPYGQG